MKAVFLDTATLGPGDVDLRPLTKQLPELEFFPATPPESVAERIAAAEIVFVNKVRLSGELLVRAPQLKLICLAATGTDNVDLAAAAKADIRVCNIRDYCSPSVVQHVFALILTLNRRLDDYRASVRNGDWAKAGQFCVLDFPFRELDGKTMGIVGYGTLGSAVGRMSAAFGMRVVAARQPYDPTDLSASNTSAEPARAGLGTVLSTADIISLHCPLTANTENLIDREALQLMRTDALLINTARGGLIDSAALLDALGNEEIGGAGIDVLCEEPPPPDEPLLQRPLPNLLVTPHVAWAGRESRQRAVDQMADNVAGFLQGKPVNEVRPDKEKAP